jgi:diaminopimelate decarboxylase
MTIGGVSVGKLAEEYGTPLYVYDREIIEKNIDSLKKGIPYPKLKIKYACKANTNLSLLKIMREKSIGIDAVSMGEVFMALEAGFRGEEILFTGDNTTEEEFEFCVKNGVPVNIGSLFQMELFGKKYPGSEILVRVNPDIGAGHHDHCITGGPDSKFGVYIHKVEEAKRIAEKYNLKIKGIHSHIGSGILETDVFMEAMNIVLEEAKHFEDLDIIDIGGGLGIPYEEKESPIDIESLGKRISERMEAFNKEYGREITLYMEPGRYIVGDAGFLLMKAVNKKSTPLFNFVGVNSGFHHLLRPMAYGSHHQIVNGSNMDALETEELVVAGNLCESGDIFSRLNGQKAPYKMGKVSYGDILVAKNAGAYGFSMASNYNSRLKPAEVLTYKGKSELIREGERLKDLLKGQVL